MGNAAIIIRTVGPHQNNISYDAERIAARTVAELKALNHNVLSASVETGGTSIVLVGPYPTELAPVKDPDYPARCAYERYLHAMEGRSPRRDVDLPDFGGLDERSQDAWRSAADPAAPRLTR